MQSTQPKTIHLKDYRQSAFFIDSISLDVNIFDDKTIVRSTLDIVKGKDFLGRSAHLELNGESMILKSLKMNGVVLNADQFQLSSDKLVILNIVQDQLVLEIENEIDPFQNKACEGFYQSGDQLCTQCEPEGFEKKNNKKKNGGWLSQYADEATQFGQYKKGGEMRLNIPVIDDAGNFDQDGIWVPDWKTMTAQAKKLGSKKVKTRSGNLINFNSNWEVIDVDDNPSIMKKGGQKCPKGYINIDGKCIKLDSQEYRYA